MLLERRKWKRMQFYSLNNPEHKVSFKQALIRGLAPDKGLYFPDDIPCLKSDFLERLPKMNVPQIAFEVLFPFVSDDITEADFEQLCKEAFDFEFPVIQIEDRVSVLELFHGPSQAFKDVGARFMASCMSYFDKEEGSLNILVATSGDTGGAVAAGFYDQPGINVHILFPQGKVSKYQEFQLTSLGKNIHCYPVQGDFDLCQSIVKEAFVDEKLMKFVNLSSANSINIGRWLAQILYYFVAYRNMENPEELTISVPSGNFGNIAAGILAKKMGLPIKHLIAATNQNDTIPRFMASGNYDPKPTKPSISNAMDVSNPSNFIRIENLLDFNKSYFSSLSFSDGDALLAIKKVFKDSGYIMEPHGATAYIGLKQTNYKGNGLFLATAHPYKFREVMPSELVDKIHLDDQSEWGNYTAKNKHEIRNYQDFYAHILNSDFHRK